MEIDLVNQVKFLAFWISSCRWFFVIFQLPIFDSAEIPKILIVLFSISLSFCFFDNVYPVIERDLLMVGVENFWQLVVFEILVGLSLSFVVKNIVSIFISAGSLITQSVGLSAVRYFDPVNFGPIGPFEKMIQMVVLLMVLKSGVFIPFIKGIYYSFFTINLQTIFNKQVGVEFFMKFFGDIFNFSIMMSSPLIIINVILSLVMGILGRFVPQINIMMVGFIINISVGFFVFSICSDEIFFYGEEKFMQLLGQWLYSIINF